MAEGAAAKDRASIACGVWAREESKPWQREPDTNWFWEAQRAWIRVLTRLCFGLETFGADNLPKTGGVLLVANHASNLDPTTIAAMLPRQVHFLAKEELLNAPGLGWYLRKVNSHPIKRGGGDRGAIKLCVDLLREGHVLLIFPEGTRTPDGELQDAKPGSAMIALQAGVPICPVYIDGSFAAWSRHMKRPRMAKMRVYVGKPFRAEEALATEGREDSAEAGPAGAGGRRNKYDAVAKLMMERIGSLKSKQ